MAGAGPHSSQSRNHTRSLPFCHLELRASKPRSCAYPVELKILGDHIRKRRLELGLLQRTIGQRIGVHCTTVWNWEKGRADPELRFLPKIIAFLGYDPQPMLAALPERLVYGVSSNPRLVPV